MSRITSRGQITIPQALRKKYGLLPNTEVCFEDREGQICLLKQESKHNKRGLDLIRSMTSKKTLGMTTDEIMNLTRT